MVDVEPLPNRPLTETEFEEFVTAQDIECPLAFHSFCTHCDTEGIVDALVRDGRTVYALHHGWEEWELNVLEEDMDPEMFHMLVKQLDGKEDLLREIAAGGHEQPPEVDSGSAIDMETDMDTDATSDESDVQLFFDADEVDAPPEMTGLELREIVDEETRQQLDAEFEEILRTRLESLSEEEHARMFGQDGEPSTEDLAALVDEDVLRQMDRAIERVLDEETIRLIEAELGIEVEDDFPMMLDVESEDRFLELYAHLLFYVNEQFDVLPGVETVAGIEERGLEELLPLRETLYEEDTEAVIEGFVAENPTDLPEEDLDQVARWTDYQYGEYVVVRHLEDYAVFLELDDPPRAFGVKAVRLPFTELWPADRLPVFVSGVALLPFEDQIVTDGWLFIQQLIVGGTISTDIDDAYEEAKHRFGLIETLPTPEEPEQSNAAQLRFYMKNKRNRERYAEEIQDLKDQTADLERIYQQELGKARARSLGRELRETVLQEAYFAIYDDRIIASGTSEDQVRDVLAEILPDGKEDHPYIYHYDPS